MTELLAALLTFRALDSRDFTAGELAQHYKNFVSSFMTYHEFSNVVPIRPPKESTFV